MPDCGVGEWISTGSIILNASIRRPGIPVGRLTTIAGKAASGKTTLASHLIKSAQAMGALVVFADTEHAYDPERGARIGVNNSELLFCQDLCLEELFASIFSTIDVSLNTGAKRPILFVVDSHSGTATRAEVEADPDASRAEVASSARLTSLDLKRLISTGLLSRARVALVFICQLKMIISTWGGGGGETYIADRPINYHSSLIIRLTRRSEMKSGDGIVVKAKITKNKVGPPFAVCEFELFNEDGIDDSRALLELAVVNKLATLKGGGYYTMGDQTFRKKEWRAMLTKDPGLRRELFGLATGMLKI